jgi:Na+/melibiose symporter-like transporter
VTRFPLGALVAYGALGLPLAMAALPLYVHLPKLYGGELGMSLAMVGAVLLGTRLLDAITDPLLGYLSDRAADRRVFVSAALPLLGVGMLGLFHPPATPQWLPLWLAALLVVTYLGFSAATIAYTAWGAQLSRDVNERTRITAARETFTLIGVVVAAALPQVLGGENGAGLARASVVFVVLLALGAAMTLGLSPRPPSAHVAQVPVLAALARPLANTRFRWLLAVFVTSGIAAAIPSTLVLFFIEDVLEAPQYAAAFLVLYFVSGAAGMPLWVALSRRIGKRNAWTVGMVLAVIAFVWAFGLQAGDAVAFGVICVLSGLALGADLALPPSLLADVIDDDGTAPEAGGEGAYFGLWTLANKANLALAAGIALPVLGALGYVPGSGGAERSLALVYALLPCAFKLVSAAILWVAPLAPRATPRFGLQGE